MLFKAGEKISITEKDKSVKSLAEEFGGVLPKILQIETLDEHPFHWFDKENLKRRAPAWFVIPNRYRDKSGDEIIYCDSFIKNEKNGNHVYQIDDKLAVRNGNPLFFKSNDLDMMFFITNHTGRVDSPNYRPEEHNLMFYVVNKKKDAIKSNKTGKSFATAYRILYEELQDQPERAKDIARVISHTDVSKLSHEEVQALLKKEIESKETHLNGKLVTGAEAFIYYTEGQHTVVPSKVREAKEFGIIIYDNGSRAWYWKKGEERGDIICKVLPTEQPDRIVIDHFTMNFKEFDNLAASVDAYKKIPELA